MLAAGMTYFEGERRRARIFLIGVVLFVPAGGLYWAQRATGVDLLAVFAFVVGCVAAVMTATGTYWPLGVKLDKKERDLGYTTNPNYFYPTGEIGYPEVSLVLPRSGTVVRFPGEPGISSREYDRLAIAEIRKTQR